MFKRQALINLILILIPRLSVIFSIIRPYLEKREKAENLQRQESQKMRENAESRRDGQTPQVEKKGPVDFGSGEWGSPQPVACP
jgi:flagellar biosynthesis/type III secretory pathway M-ring protein FliF/YscJ